MAEGIKFKLLGHVGEDVKQWLKGNQSPSHSCFSWPPFTDIWSKFRNAYLLQNGQVAMLPGKNNLPGSSWGECCQLHKLSIKYIQGWKSGKGGMFDPKSPKRLRVLSNESKTQYIQDGFQKGTTVISKEWLRVLSQSLKSMTRGVLKKGWRVASPLLLAPLDAPLNTDRNLKKSFYSNNNNYASRAAMPPQALAKECKRDLVGIQSLPVLKNSTWTFNFHLNPSQVSPPALGAQQDSIYRFSTSLVF